MNQKKIKKEYDKHKYIPVLVVSYLCFLVTVFATIAIPKQTDFVYVNDYADVLSSETIDYLITQNALLAQEHGVHIIVATVETLDGHEIEAYAMAMFEEWYDLSERSHVLLLLVTKENKYWIIPGKGIENVFNPITLASILKKDLEPSLGTKDYNQGILESFRSIYRILDGSDSILESGDSSNPFKSKPQNDWIGLLVDSGTVVVQMAGSVLLAIIVLALFRPRRFRRHRGPFLPQFLPRQRDYHRRRFSTTTSKDNGLGNRFGARLQDTMPTVERGSRSTTRQSSRGERTGR